MPGMASIIIIDRDHADKHAVHLALVQRLRAQAAEVAG